jgi:hypothetical protein
MDLTMNCEIEEQLLSRMRKAHQDTLICSPDTDLVIEGYPRSGNTFVHDMIMVLTDGGQRLKIAHHTHAAENLALATFYGVPGCVLIRPPEDAILSYHIYSGYDIEECVRRYRAFYAAVDGLTGPTVIAEFAEITGNFGVVIQKLNSILSRPLPAPANLEAAASAALQRAGTRAIKTHGPDVLRKGGVPSPERDKVKAGLRKRVQNYLRAEPGIHRLYREVVASA